MGVRAKRARTRSHACEARPQKHALRARMPHSAHIFDAPIERHYLSDTFAKRLRKGLLPPLEPKIFSGVACFARVGLPQVGWWLVGWLLVACSHTHFLKLVGWGPFYRTVRNQGCNLIKVPGPGTFQVRKLISHQQIAKRKAFDIPHGPPVTQR